MLARGVRMNWAVSAGWSGAGQRRGQHVVRRHFRLVGVRHRFDRFRAHPADDAAEVEVDAAVDIVADTEPDLVPADPLAPARQEDLELVTRLAFGQRRKMLRRSLQAIGGAELLAQAGIAETARAEELTVHQFCALANALEGRRL